MIHKNKNFAFKKITGIKSGDTFEDCNLSQAEQNTNVLKGLKNITIKNCNCRNCVFPKDTKFVGCKPYHMEIPPEPPVFVNDPHEPIKQIFNSYTEDEILRVIGKAKVKTYFNLKEATAPKVIK